MTSSSRTHFLSLAALMLLWTPAAPTLAGQATNSAAADRAIVGIQLSFKRDPRVIDPYRGIEPWVTGSNYNSATAQEVVEVRAAGVDAGGKVAKIDPEWKASDPDMVTISPARGDEVKVRVHKAGESNLTVTYQGHVKELVIKAKYVGTFMVFEIAAATVAPGNGGAAAQMNPALKSRAAQISYAAGMRLAGTLRKQSVEADPELVSQAVRDVLAGGPTLMTETQASSALFGVETELNVTAAALERKQIAEKNKRAGARFLAQNKRQDGVVALPSGLQYKVLRSGHGKKPTALDVAVCHYKGTLLDGTEFDNSRKTQSASAVRFPVRSVIRGWQEALKRMPAGSTWQLFVPPELAYGERGMPRARIPANATLIFEVELLGVQDGTSSAAVAAAASPKSLEKVLTSEQIASLKNAAQAEHVD
jgi:FKBP-type peptidyl-prolyl cis-trans isomerase